MEHRHVSNNAEPGTGTQIHVVASPPCGCRGELDSEECGDINHKHPNTYHLHGRTWKVGHEYIDVEIADVVELTEVVRRSPWCSTKPPEEGTLYLCFEAERAGACRIDPNAHKLNEDRMDLTDRFLERYTSDPPLGAPNPPW